MTQSLTFNPDANNRCQQYVLEAIKARPGITYQAIRYWILQKYRFNMENVGGRVRELARDCDPPKVSIEYDKNGHVHCFAVEGA